VAIKDDVKLALRISNSAYDNEITDLIAAATKDLTESGVTAAAAVDTDTLIKRAIVTYCKAHFGWNNPDSERLQRAYDLLKGHLTLTADYAYFAIAFTVKDALGAAIREASVTFDGKTLVTGAAGTVIFYRRPGNNYEYKISADGYDADDDDDNLVDVVASAVSINITLTEE
jgi:uncharacterized phage protein (predicted DNA packaging)